MNCQRSFKSEPFRSGDFRLLEKRKWHDWAIERKHRHTWGFMKYIESRSESKRYCCFYIFLAPNKANAALCFLLFTRTLEAHQKVVILPISVGSYLLRLPTTETCQFDDKLPNSQPPHSFNHLNSFDRRKSNQLNLHLDYIEGKMA